MRPELHSIAVKGLAGRGGRVHRRPLSSRLNLAVLLALRQRSWSSWEELLEQKANWLGEKDKNKKNGDDDQHMNGDDHAINGILDIGPTISRLRAPLFTSCCFEQSILMRCSCGLVIKRETFGTHHRLRHAASQPAAVSSSGKQDWRILKTEDGNKVRLIRVSAPAPPLLPPSPVVSEAAVESEGASSSSSSSLSSTQPLSSEETPRSRGNEEEESREFKVPPPVAAPPPPPPSPVVSPRLVPVRLSHPIRPSPVSRPLPEAIRRPAVMAVPVDASRPRPASIVIMLPRRQLDSAEQQRMAARSSSAASAQPSFVYRVQRLPQLPAQFLLQTADSSAATEDMPVLECQQQRPARLPQHPLPRRSTGQTQRSPNTRH